MAEVYYRIFYNNEPAQLDQMERIEEIVVEQEENMAWEASVKIPICADAQGNWREGDESLITTLERVRIEIKVGENPFVPLIDGPVVRYRNVGSSQPGQSNITFSIQDDSVFLNRQAEHEQFEDQSDHEIARELLMRPEQITQADVDSVPNADSTVERMVVRRGTEIEVLRQLARRNQMYVAVLPGESPGESQGYFKNFPTQLSDLSPLVLLGTQRNVDQMDIQNRTQQSSRVTAASISIGDQTIIEQESNFQDIELMGDGSGFNDTEESATGRQFLPPNEGESNDLQHRVNAESERSTYSFQASGNVKNGCYPDVLFPYKVVSVRGVRDRLVGSYRLKKVTHTINRSAYSQAFELVRNAVSESNGNSQDIINRIF
jgi:phage protein D